MSSNIVKRLDYGDRSKLVRDLDACGASREQIAAELYARGMATSDGAVRSIISYALRAGKKRCAACHGKGWTS